jgi:hypothetical protein
MVRLAVAPQLAAGRCRPAPAQDPALLGVLAPLLRRWWAGPRPATRSAGHRQRIRARSAARRWFAWRNSRGNTECGPAPCQGRVGSTLHTPEPSYPLAPMTALAIEVEGLVSASGSWWRSTGWTAKSGRHVPGAPRAQRRGEDHHRGDPRGPATSHFWTGGGARPLLGAGGVGHPGLSGGAAGTRFHEKLTVERPSPSSAASTPRRAGGPGHRPGGAGEARGAGGDALRRPRSSGWRWRWAWWPTPSCSSSTSRRPDSIPPAVEICGRSSRH